MSSPIACLAGTGLIFSFLLLASPILGESELLSVVANEIAWMGTKSSYNNEWIELYNNKSFQINLEGWKLAAKDGTPEINLSGIIPANGFYLLERTNDDTLPEVSADQIYSGALENSGESLILYDSSGNPIDSVNCSSGWFAGDNSTKQTMERKNPLSTASSENWGTSQNSGGTPKAKNSVSGETLPSPNPSQGKTEERTENQAIYPSNIFINEILPSPEGPDETDEWVEISNKNNFEVDLSGWKIKDSIGKSATYVFSKGTKIPSQGLLTLSRQTTKITLNNDGDEMFLLKPDGKIAGSVSYGKAPIGQSYNKTGQDWAWSNILTPGLNNKISEIVSPQNPQQSSLQTVKEKGNQVKKEGKAAGGQFSEKFPVYLPASILAIFSGAIILLLKMKLKISDIP